MSIRLKIGVLLGILLVGIVALNFMFAIKFILPSFGRIEDESAKINVERILEAYNNEFEYLGSKNADWSNWDDTYEFIVDQNSEYIESNLTNVSVENLKLDVMIFLDAKGDVVYQKGYDLDSHQSITDFSGWSEHIKTGAVITDYVENKFKRGLIMVDNRPILFAARPILTSNATGPSRGTIIFAKYFDSVEIEGLANLTKLKIAIDPLDKTSDNLDSKKAIDSLIQTGADVYVVKSDDNYLHGHSLLKDCYGKPQLFLEVSLKREIYNQGLSAVRYFILVSAIAGLVLLTIISILLELMVIKKIIKFNSNIHEIAQKKDFSQKISIEGNDEFSRMGANTNIMLEALEKAAYKTETEHQKSQTYLRVMETLLVALDLDGIVTFANEKALEILGLSTRDEIIGKSWLENFILKKDQAEIRALHKTIAADKERSIYHENLILTKNGNERLIAWHNAALKDGAGKIIGVVSSGDDVTESKKQIVLERNRTKELEEKNNELERFHSITMERELKMAELKKKIKELEAGAK